MLYRIIITLLFPIIIGNAWAEQFQSVAPIDSSGADGNKKGNSAGAVIAIGILAAAGAGVGGYFLCRRALRERRHADSIIHVVETAWDSAGKLYANEHYRDAIAQLQKITVFWYEYERYSTKYRKKRHVHPDSIRAVIASCDFLERMIQPIKILSEFAERLPEDEFSLSRFSRRELIGAKQYLQHTMDSITTVHPNHRTALRYSFRHINRRLRIVDSLLKTTYGQQKTDFTAKNKYYYNRAIESNDTAELRHFVEDCDYFQVDKEWCQRGRIILREKPSDNPATVPPTKKMTTRDSIQFAYQEAMTSKRIELLEAYVAKYSSRRYRSLQRLAKIDSVKAALRTLRMEIEKEIAFNKAYPRFGKTGKPEIPISVKGLSNATEAAFRTVWDYLRPDMAKLHAIRLPAKLDIDYSSQPPMLTLDAVVSPKHDIEKITINSRQAFRVSCLLPAMKHLQRLKTMTIKLINKDRRLESKPSNIIDYEVNKVGSAIYLLRLVKPGNRGTILFYARDNSEAGNDTTNLIQFYDFYDMTAAGHETKRFPIYPGSLPNVIPSLASDSLEQVMGADFFGE